MTSVDLDLFWANEHVWSETPWVETWPVDLYSLWFVTQGRVEVRIAGEEHVLTEGQWALWPQGQGRSIRSATESRWFSIGPKASLFGCLDLFEDLSLPAVWRCDEVDTDLARVLFIRLLTEWGDGKFITRRPSLFGSTFQAPEDVHAQWDQGKSLIVEGAARTILGLVWKSLDVGGGRTSERSRMPRWLRHSLQSMRKNPSIKPGMLAEHHGISPAHFRRAFHQFLEVSPQEHLTRLRLEEARRALILTELPISEVATISGFESPVHFSKIFHRRVGLSPSAYRSAGQNSLSDQAL